MPHRGLSGARGNGVWRTLHLLSVVQSSPRVGGTMIPCYEWERDEKLRGQ